MKAAKGVQLLVIMALVIAATVLLAQPIINNLNLGLDLQGGVHVVLQARSEEGQPVAEQDMNELQAVMRQRVDELGISEPVIQRGGNQRLIVELAGVDDPEEAVRIIGKVALLEFKDFEGNTVLTGRDLSDAKAIINTQTNQPEISLEFKGEGAKKFGDITTKLSQNYPVNDPRRRIAIYLDEELLTNPEVQGPITDGKAVITGNRSFDEAVNIAALLRGGALPVSVDIIEKRTVGPTLGSDSLNKSVIAIIWGISAVMLFMLLYYMVPGLVANFSLLVYGLLVMGILGSLGATLTLPGIAGLLLSVGMAVDANIIIYERLKEELKVGKTLRAAVDAAFRHAKRTILDANFTTLIAAALLYQFGTGPIRGFAVTLSLGIIISVVVALLFTRYLLRLVVGIAAFNKPRLYGLRG